MWGKPEVSLARKEIRNTSPHSVALKSPPHPSCFSCNAEMEKGPRPIGEPSGAMPKGYEWSWRVDLNHRLQRPERSDRASN